MIVSWRKEGGFMLWKEKGVGVSRMEPCSSGLVYGRSAGVREYIM